MKRIEYLSICSCVKSSVRCITNLGGVADGEQPCEHTGIAVNGQEPKHPGQPQQGKENDSGLQGGSDNRNVNMDLNKRYVWHIITFI